MEIDERAIAERWRMMEGALDERSRRRFAAAEARSHGRGGIAAVVRATAVSESTVRRGLRELESGGVLEAGRVRRAGAGRKRLTDKDPSLVGDLERLVDPAVRGDPERPLRWTSKSAAKLARGLCELGHPVSDRTVLRTLKALDYSLQANRKTKEGSQHPDRDAQFRHISQAVSEALAAGAPVISVDTKKKELVGDFKAVGRELAAKGSPVPVRGHDFKDRRLGKAVPYGVYDLGENKGLVSVGIDNDTAQFSVASIRATRLWKTELGRLADQTGLAISVCHFPPGTSKWNKIEHRLFSFITHNWRGKPLISHEVIINLIAATTTQNGLEVYARLDQGSYPKGVEVTDAQLAAVNLEGGTFHPEWNYTIKPSVITS